MAVIRGAAQRLYDCLCGVDLRSEMGNQVRFTDPRLAAHQGGFDTAGTRCLPESVQLSQFAVPAKQLLGWFGECRLAFRFGQEEVRLQRIRMCGMRWWGAGLGAPILGDQRASFLADHDVLP